PERSLFGERGPRTMWCGARDSQTQILPHTPSLASSRRLWHGAPSGQQEWHMASHRASPAASQMASREGAIARALAYFDGNGFRDRLAGLVAIPSTSQDPAHEADVRRYLA